MTVSRENLLPDGGAAPGHNELVLLVRDDGVGFDSSLAAEAFEPDERLSLASIRQSANDLTCAIGLTGLWLN